MEENALRLGLLAAGIVVLLGIYFYDAWKKKTPKDESDLETTAAPVEKVNPVISSEASFSAVFNENKPLDAEVLETNLDIEPKNSSTEVSQRNADVEDGDSFDDKAAPVIQLVVEPFQDCFIQGDVLLNTFTQLGLEFGEMDIFHYYERQNGEEVQLFHVANLLEPGTFPVGNMADFESTGVVLFFQTNDTFKATTSFDSMLTVAQQLSQMLNANLMGGDMKELTLDKINDIRLQLSELSN